MRQQVTQKRVCSSPALLSCPQGSRSSCGPLPHQLSAEMRLRALPLQMRTNQTTMSESENQNDRQPWPWLPPGTVPKWLQKPATPSANESPPINEGGDKAGHWWDSPLPPGAPKPMTVEDWMRMGRDLAAEEKRRRGECAVPGCSDLRDEDSELCLVCHFRELIANAERGTIGTHLGRRP